MPKELSRLLQQTADRELHFLQSLGDEAAARQPRGPGSWSPKQELGHLIDSAANNHIRFVVASIQTEMKGPGYAQDAWVDVHAYQDMPWANIVSFWHQYNTFIAALVGNIPFAKLDTTCQIGSGDPVTLRFIIEDYVVHMQHHIDHLLGRAVITAYPQTIKQAS
jgi:hypothetical protein